MGLELEQQDQGRLLVVRAGGKLTKSDYDRFVPEVDQMVAKAGKINVLLILHDFHGWTAPAAWEDLKFGLRHFSGIGRLALVGQKRWQSWMAKVCRPFTKAQVRYFSADQVDQATKWVQELQASTV